MIVNLNVFESVVRQYDSIKVDVLDNGSKLVMTGKNLTSETVFESTLPIEDIKNMNGLEDGSIFGLSIVNSLIHINGSTHNTKEHPIGYALKQQPEIGCVIFMPHKNASFNEALIAVLMNNTVDVASELTTVDYTPGGWSALRNSIMPRLRLSAFADKIEKPAISIPANQTGTIFVHALDADSRPLSYDITAELQTTSGYCPYGRVLVRAGQSVPLPLSAMGLQENDTIKVKIGTIGHTGLDSYIIQVGAQPLDEAGLFINKLFGGSLTEQEVSEKEQKLRELLA